MIGVFDSGYGGLTILRALQKELPEHDFLYLGDNARSPYGTRSFETIYHYTLQAVEALFRLGCPLVILACNTASARALRNIQQKDLPRLDPQRRVLGVLRPSVEQIGFWSHSGHAGILATPGTVRSESYPIETAKFFPDLQLTQQECPMLVPLVENRELDNAGAEYFVQQYLDSILSRDPKIDTLLLGCTHYPLLAPLFRKLAPEHVQIVEQGPVIAASLNDYLQRHPEMDQRLAKSSNTLFLTTEQVDTFNPQASFFYGKDVEAEHIDLS